MTVTRFDSLDAVREFAGEEYELAVISDEAAPAPLVIRRARSDRIGAAAVVLDDSRRVLLVRHTYGRLNWELLGAGLKRRNLPSFACRYRAEARQRLPRRACVEQGFSLLCPWRATFQRFAARG
jgi:hypothetical protein